MKNQTSEAKMKVKLSAIEYQSYLNESVIPVFQPLMEQHLNSYIINRNLQIEIGTNLAAKAFGSLSGSNLSWLNFSNYQNEAFLQRLFKQSYERYGKKWLSFHLKKLVYLQHMVFKKGRIIQFIDMLPYNNQYISLMTTYTPIIHPNSGVIAIQASTIETYILRFQGHIDNPNISTYDKKFHDQFSTREHEILFLICNGATQEHIAKILKISRGTVSTIIHNQIGPKFGMSGSNIKELMKQAIHAGMSRSLPEALWYPCIIVLNRELLDDINLTDVGF